MLGEKFIGKDPVCLVLGFYDNEAIAISFIKTIQDRQGLRVACVEEIAYRMGFIDEEQFLKLGEALRKSTYGEYLLRAARDGLAPE